MICNHNCDGTHCKQQKGEVRMLPTGGGGNMILCLDCFLHEMSFRRQRNIMRSGEPLFKLPKWSELKVYEG